MQPYIKDCVNKSVAAMLSVVMTSRLATEMSWTGETHGARVYGRETTKKKFSALQNLLAAFHGKSMHFSRNSWWKGEGKNVLFLVGWRVKIVIWLILSQLCPLHFMLNTNTECSIHLQALLLCSTESSLIVRKRTLIV